MNSIKQISSNKSFGGWHQQFSHHSKVLNCDMRFAIFLPPQASPENKVPVLYWLSGLTCSDENFMQKSAVQQIAAELGIAIVAPDTSPRGDNVADDEAYDLGKGAGFYVNATQQPWAQHYQMYDYIVNELPTIIEDNFSVTAKRSISGHSMGGHGALMIALRNPHLYQSVSAFSPICNPSDCPWGVKAFTAYLGKEIGGGVGKEAGNDNAAWSTYDASELMANYSADIKVPAMVEQGGGDNFLTEQLKPEALIEAAKVSNYPLTLNIQQEYDHSYYFIASFIDKHMRFHAQYL